MATTAVAQPQAHQEAPLPDFPRFPGDGAGAFKTGKYRNLFTEQLGKSQAEARAKIDRAFDRLFHGDGQEERIYFETGANASGPLAYITDWNNNDARSEGLSYGMMIAVQLGRKREFDALWNWCKTYMQVTDPKNPSFGYFAWSLNTDGTPRSTGAAPDGEEYFAMALYFAANRWGNGKGIYNYKAEADRILHVMRHRAVMTGTPPFRVHPNDPPLVEPDKPWPSPSTRRDQARAQREGRPWPPVRPPRTRPVAETVGPMMEESHAMIRFVPNTWLPGTDPSYHLPAFYELWARWGPIADRSFWAKAADVSRDFLFRVTGPKTGLSPERSYFDASPIPDWNGGVTPFGPDSWRTASNWSVDHSWWGKDARQRILSDRIQGFLFGEGMDKFADRYTTDGKPLGSAHSVGLLAATAVAGFAATPGAPSKAFLQGLWDAPIPDGEFRYYAGLLYLMSMMHCSGEFRIIGPR